MNIVKDFNTFNSKKWLRPPIINCVDRTIIVHGLIPKGRKLKFVSEFFYGYEPIGFLDNKVIHWNLDFSKCFTYSNKNEEVPYEKWIHSVCS
jgi:hypothetical protein